MKSRFIYIILAIMLVLLVNPYLQTLGAIGQLLTTLILASIPLSCAFALTRHKRKAIFILFIAAPFVIIDALHFFFTSQLLLIINLGLGIFLYFYIAFLMVKHLLSIKAVTADMIYSAISIYLLIGIGWSGIYDLLEIISPGSFSGQPEADLLYFSFITLTTVGYGDILPLSVFAQRLVIIEATMGSIYMAVIVAIIVGRYMSMPDGESEVGLKE
jgi:hypothetical protein